MKQFPRTALLVWLLVLAAAVWEISRAPITTDLTAFLPPSADETQELLLEQMRDGVASRIMLLTIEGENPGQLARASKSLAARLVSSDQFIWVNNGDPELLRAERDYLKSNRYLLGPEVEPERFSVPRLRVALEDAVRLATSPAGAAMRGMIPSDPTGEFLRVLATVGGGEGPRSQSGVWFSADGRRALLLAETAAPGFDALRQQRAVDTVRAAYSSLDEAPNARLLLSGPGVFAAESRAVIEGDSWRLSAAAAIIVLTFLTIVHRSLRRVLLCTLPVVTGLVVGSAAVGFAFGSIHGITLGFGATLIGETVDYPAYLLLNARREETTAETLARIWPTLRLAVLTTVFGGLTMLASGFSGLSQLGLLSVVGVLAAGLVTRWIVPGFAGPARVLNPPSLFARLAMRPASSKVKLAAWILGASALAFIATRNDRIWSDDLADLSPVSAESRALDRTLRSELSAPDVRHLIVVFGTTREQALERSEVVARSLRARVAAGQLGGFEYAAGYLPSRALQMQKQAALPDAKSLDVNLTEAARDLPFRAGLFAPFLLDVAEAKSRAALTMQDLGTTAIAARVRSLLIESGGRWAALIALRSVNDPRALSSLSDEAGNEHVRVLDLKEISHRMVNNYRDEALKFTMLGMLAIFAVLLGGLRRALDVARVITPVLLAVLFAVSGLLLLGEKLTLFHVVALLLVSGIGLNYALFFNRPDTDPQTRGRTLTVVAVCASTTICTFGILALSATPVLHAIGVTVALGASCSLALSAVLAPQRT